MRGAIALVVTATLVAGANVAGAAELTADDLITRGLALRRASKPEEALELFQRAHRLASSPRTLGQMGLVEASLERWLDAHEHLTASIAMPADGWVRRNRVLLRQALGLVQRHVGQLVITGPPGTDVAVDGTRVGTLPRVQPVTLAEGRAVVTASSSGFKEFSKTVTIAGGAQVSMAIVLDPDEKRPAVALSAPVPVSAPTPALLLEDVDDYRTAWRTWTGAGLVAAGAGLLTWGIVWIAVDGHDYCAIGGPSCTTVYDTRTRGWILAAGGAAAAAGGTALLLIGRRSDSSNLMFAATPSTLLVRGQF